MGRVGIIGGGAWGTALATVTARTGAETLIWARETEVVTSINSKHENKIYLPNIRINATVKATEKLEACFKSDALFLVVPSQYLRGTIAQLKNLGLPEHIPLILCSKGIESDSLKLLSEVVESLLGNSLSILSGPSFASEVALGLPTSVTLASSDLDYAKRKIVPLLEHEAFKLHLSNDIIGTEIGGAVKNVIAIACGIAAGKRLGRNATAAIITQGLNEMALLCEAKGGDPKTLMQLCGVGDLILTCSSQNSRNMSLGYELGEGASIQDIMDRRNSVAEGVASSLSVTRLAESLGITLPLCNIVYSILHEEREIEEGVNALVAAS